MALRADTARHLITGATVLIFSAAAIGTAMRYQDNSPASDLPLAAELPAREASAAAQFAQAGPLGYHDATRGSGSDIAATLDGTVAFGGNAGGGLPSREGGHSANAGSARWWADTSTRMTATSGRRSGGGSVSLPGSGYSVSGRRANGPAAQAPRGPGNSRGNGGGRGSAGGGGNGGSPVFGDHTTPVDDLVDVPAVIDNGGPGNPGGGGGFDPGGLAHSPEPASLLLMATGALGVFEAARRRRRRK